MGGFDPQEESHPDGRTPGRPQGVVHLVLLLRQ